MGNELVLAQDKNLPQVLHLGKVLHESGYFGDVKSAAQAVVKILRGQELGIGPVTALEQIYVVQGKTSLSAALIGSLIKQSGRYDYQLLRLDEQGCEIAFFSNGNEIGRSRFMQEDARKAGLASRDMWQKYPRNMYFSRALSNGARWYCPDVFRGAVYTREELSDGTVVEDVPVEVSPSPNAASPPAEEPRAERVEENTQNDDATGETADHPITAQDWSDFWKACRTAKLSQDAVHKAFAPVYFSVQEVKSLKDHISTKGELDAFLAYIKAGGQPALA